MAGLDTQWKALVKQLKKLEIDTRKARGEARARLKKLDRQTRKMVERTLRQAEPHVRQAMKDAARVGRRSLPSRRHAAQRLHGRGVPGKRRRPR